MAATYRASVTYSGNLASQVVTVPAGVTTTDFGIIILSWAASVANETSTMTATGWAAPPSPYAATGTANMGFAVIIRDGGQVAGDNISVSWSISTRLSEIVAIWYDNGGQPIDVASVVSTRGGTSSLVSALAGVTTTGANDTLIAIYTERSTASGTVPSTYSGITFTQDFFHENTATSNTSTYVGHAAGPVTAGATGTSSLTYTGGAASGNSGTLLLALKTAGSGSTAAGAVSIAATATAQAPATATAAVGVAATATATPAGGGAAAVVIAATAVASARASVTGSISIGASAVAGAPTLVRVIFERDITALRVSGLTLNTATMRLGVSTTQSAGNITSGSYSTSTVPDAQGYVTNVSVTGLSANTAYYYQVELNGALVGAAVLVRTAQTVGTPVSSLDLFGSCVQNGGTFGSTIPNPTVFQSMVGRVSGVTGRIADYFSPLGDKIYDWNAASPNGDYMPAVAATIRAAYERGFGGALLRGMHASISTQDGWSDNDSFGGNSDAGLNAGTPYWPASDGTSLSVWKQLMVYPTLSDSNANYRAKGDGTTLRIYTDTRSYAVGATTTDNSSKTKLGFTQRAWFIALIQGARAAGYAQILWFCDDLWVDTGGTSTSGNAGLPTQNDGWGAYGNERGVIAAAIIAAGWGNKGLLFLCGDTHSILMDDGAHNAYGGFPIFCCAPFYQTATANGTGLTFNVASYPTGSQAGMFYGAVEIAASASGMTVTCTAWDATSSAGVTASDVSRGSMTWTFANISGAISISASAAAQARPTSTGAVSIAATAGAVQSSTATAAIAVAATATGKASSTATGAVSIASTVTGQGSAQAVAALTFSASVAAQAPVAATGAVTISGAASGTPAGGASATITVAGSSNPFAPATATASVSISAAGTALASPNAVGAVSISATATAAGPGTTATGSITVTGTSSGRALVAAAGQVTINGTVIAVAPATAAGLITVNASAPHPVSASATATVTIVAAAVASAVTYGGGPWRVFLPAQDRWRVHLEVS